MRFMSFVKSPENSPPPPPAFLAAIEKAREEAMRSGKVVDTGGLAPTARSSRVRLAGGKVTVTDGPFTEAREVIGGYAVLEVASKEEAVESAVWLLNFHKEYWPGWEGEVEVRQLLGPEDVRPDGSRR